MEDVESDRVVLTIAMGDETYVWVYPLGEHKRMRDVVVEQVEEDRLHPYVGVMALHAMREL